jgi:undecaprenyl diphosphate synthase
MPFKNIPKILALIPDGNRRWAKQNKISFLVGYKQGVKKFIDFSEWCNGYGINNISVWAFSTENINRPKEEVNALFGIYKKTATDRKIIDRLHENETSFKLIGNLTMLPKDLRMALGKVAEETSVYKKKTINMLIGYGGKEDIMRAARRAAADAVKTGKVALNESIFKKYLISNSIPDIDFVIRTSGEERLSGFMPWQAAYSELYFSKKLWPDFTRNDLDAALSEYDRRARRFGL